MRTRIRKNRIKILPIKPHLKNSDVYYRNGIRRGKMCHANNTNQKRTNNGKDRTAKSIKSQNGRRQRKLQVLGNIRS